MCNSQIYFLRRTDYKLDAIDCSVNKKSCVTKDKVGTFFCICLISHPKLANISA